MTLSFVQKYYKIVYVYYSHREKRYDCKKCTYTKAIHV